MRISALISGLLTLAAATFAQAATPFDRTVRPILGQVCITCHNGKLQSGGLNITGFLDPASLQTNRETWERILAKLQTGEMPPKGIPKPPPEQMAALIQYVQTEFDHADRNAKPDPGRIVTHRLNRSEYSNTIRDLLGVDFRANEEFPADDSGFGFDNIGEVLTVSPTLMQKYLQAGEQIASRAVGGDPLPKAGLFNPRDRVRRLDTGIIQLKYRIEYDADYLVRADLTGHRGPQDKAVTLVLSVDGKPVKTADVPVQISAVNRQGGATQRSSQEIRLNLTEGEHTFQAEFVNDDAVASIPETDRLNTNKNIYPESIEIAGPFPSEEKKAAHASRKAFLTCDPATGRALCRKHSQRPNSARVSPSGNQGRSGRADAGLRQGQRRRSHSRAESAIRHHGDAGLAAVPVPHRTRSEVQPKQEPNQPCPGRRTGIAPELLPLELHAGRRTDASRRIQSPARARRIGCSDRAHDRGPEVALIRGELRRTVA